MRDRSDGPALPISMLMHGGSDSLQNDKWVTDIVLFDGDKVDYGRLHAARELLADIMYEQAIAEQVGADPMVIFDEIVHNLRHPKPNSPPNILTAAVIDYALRENSPPLH